MSKAHKSHLALDRVSGESRRHHYTFGDIEYLYGTLSLYRHALDAGRAGRFCRYSTQLVETWGHVFQRYPNVRCYPLDKVYALLLSVGTLNPAVLEDLIYGHSFRGLSWGAFVAALAPQSDYLPILQHAIDGGAPSQQHAMLRVAIARCHRRDIDEATDAEAIYATAVAALATLLEEVEAPKLPLRRSPSLEEENYFKRERAAVGQAYRDEGVLAARSTLSKTLLYWYAQPFERYCRNRPPKPEMIDDTRS